MRVCCGFPCILCIFSWFCLRFVCVLREKIELYDLLLVSLVFFDVFCGFCLRFVCFLWEKKGRNNTLVCDGLNFFGFLCILSCILLDLPAFYVCFFTRKQTKLAELLGFLYIFWRTLLVLSAICVFFARKKHEHSHSTYTYHPHIYIYIYIYISVLTQDMMPR